ncbi:MAG: COX15/CtaA family protein [Candidatus Paracaedibacteraceae bacterium]|nr:COX15/CtaA family protein [Candidatus Paracaedibacteraceae bacterium]
MNKIAHPNRAITLWLFGTCLLIWLMIMLGGATRLTHSGLSIVEWKPIVGIIPPLTQEAWLQEFAKYQQFPEYQLVNQGMTLSEFKFIFFMEYAHRLLGRLMGLFFFLPLIWFWVKGQLSLGMKKMSLIVALIGMAQGFMGWYMVKSGLVKDPSVSHYRLTAHLMLALVLFATLFFAGLRHVYPHEKQIRGIRSTPVMLTHFSALAIMITITYGGFVAGLKAGKMYNTYPLMGGDFIPYEWNHLTPVWLNFFENAATVQWTHRTLAILTMTLVLLAMTGLVRSDFGKSVKDAAKLMIVGVVFQVILGIVTLLHEVPVSLGTLHQGVAVIVLALILNVIFNIHRRPYNHQS